MMHLDGDDIVPFGKRGVGKIDVEVGVFVHASDGAADGERVVGDGKGVGHFVAVHFVAVDIDHGTIVAQGRRTMRWMEATPVMFTVLRK